MMFGFHIKLQGCTSSGNKIQNKFLLQVSLEFQILSQEVAAACCSDLHQVWFIGLGSRLLLSKMHKLLNHFLMDAY